MKIWNVYIMSNKTNEVIYIGVTDDLQERVKEHKMKVYPNSFTAKYNCNKLVYFEDSTKGEDAVVREKQMKKWKRVWKIKLIEEMNPNRMDISLNWKFDFNKLRNER